MWREALGRRQGKLQRIRRRKAKDLNSYLWEWVPCDSGHLIPLSRCALYVKLFTSSSREATPRARAFRRNGCVACAHSSPRRLRKFQLQRQVLELVALVHAFRGKT